MKDDAAVSLSGDRSSAGTVREPLGVATFLPPAAAEALVRAASAARDLPAGSIDRAKVVADAVKRVKARHGAYFVQDDGRSE